MRFLGAAFSKDGRTFPVNGEMLSSRHGRFSFSGAFREKIDSGPAELLLPDGAKYEIIVTSSSKVDPQRNNRGICEFEVMSNTRGADTCQYQPAMSESAAPGMLHPLRSRRTTAPGAALDRSCRLRWDAQQAGHHLPARRGLGNEYRTSPLQSGG